MNYLLATILIVLIESGNSSIHCQNGGDSTLRCAAIDAGHNVLDTNINAFNLSYKRYVLKGCKLRRIAQQTFSGSIRSLDLSQNFLSYLEDNVFANAVQLRSVNLSSNFLTALNRNVFRPLTELRRLDLANNALTVFESEADFLMGLPIKVLDLSNNIMVDLERVFSATKLTSLTAVNNRIKLSDKQTIFDGNHLKLSNNEDMVLSSNTFSAKINLINLDLCYNKIKVLPPRIFSDNTKLKILNVSHNELQALDGTVFATNVQLEYLDLSDNRLESIAQNVFSTTNKLLHLDLSGNNLSKLGLLLFQSLPNLLILDLANNKLRALHSSLFSKNTKLNILRLDRNYLKSFEKLQFTSNRDLIALTLSQNEIVDFKHTLVYNLFKLMVLDLDRNNLTAVDPNLTNLPRLTHLYISCNSIATFDPAFFETLESKLVIVRIYGNPLKCTCINNLIDYQRRVIPDKKDFADGNSATCFHYNGETSDNCWSDDLEPKLYMEWLSTFNKATTICKRD